MIVVATDQSGAVAITYLDDSGNHVLADDYLTCCIDHPSFAYYDPTKLGYNPFRNMPQSTINLIFSIEIGGQHA